MVPTSLSWLWVKSQKSCTVEIILDSAGNCMENIAVYCQTSQQPTINAAQPHMLSGMSLAAYTEMDMQSSAPATWMLASTADGRTIMSPL